MYFHIHAIKLQVAAIYTDKTFAPTMWVGLIQLSEHTCNLTELYSVIKHQPSKH